MLRIPDASLTQIGSICSTARSPWRVWMWSHAVVGVDHPVGLTPSACGRSLIVFGTSPHAMVTYRETNFFPVSFPLSPIRLCDGAHIKEHAGRRGETSEKVGRDAGTSHNSGRFRASGRSLEPLANPSRRVNEDFGRGCGGKCRKFRHFHRKLRLFALKFRAFQRERKETQRENVSRL